MGTTVTITSLCTIALGAITVWGLFTSPGFKNKAFIVAIFLSGVFLATTAFGLWAKAFTTEMGGKTVTTVDGIIN